MKFSLYREKKDLLKRIYVTPNRVTYLINFVITVIQYKYQTDHFCSSFCMLLSLFFFNKKLSEVRRVAILVRALLWVAVCMCGLLSQVVLATDSVINSRYLWRNKIKLTLITRVNLSSIIMKPYCVKALKHICKKKCLFFLIVERSQLVSLHYKANNQLLVFITHLVQFFFCT